MTYSVELFICMILGLVIGHGIFNTGQSNSSSHVLSLLIPGAAVGESVDPCCASQAVTPDTSRPDEAAIM